MDTRLNVLSPFSIHAYRSAAPTAAAPPAATGDSYVGSVLPGAPPAAAPDPAQATHRLRAVLLGTFALAGVFGGLVAAQAQSIPPPQISTTQTVAYSNPGRSLPPNSNVDTNTWLKDSRAAFQAIQKGDAGAFGQQASPGGVWVRGLQGAPKTATGMVYMTNHELKQDLQQKGPLYREVFQSHSNARLVLTPDSQGHFQTILLD